MEYYNEDLFTYQDRPFPSYILNTNSNGQDQFNHQNSSLPSFTQTPSSFSSSFYTQFSLTPGDPYYLSPFQSQTVEDDYSMEQEADTSITFPVPMLLAEDYPLPPDPFLYDQDLEEEESWMSHPKHHHTAVANALSPFPAQGPCPPPAKPPFPYPGFYKKAKRIHCARCHRGYVRKSYFDRHWETQEKEGKPCSAPDEHGFSTFAIPGYHIKKHRRGRPTTHPADHP